MVQAICLQAASPKAAAVLFFQIIRQEQVHTKKSVPDERDKNRPVCFGKRNAHGRAMGFYRYPTGES